MARKSPSAARRAQEARKGAFALAGAALAFLALLGASYQADKAAGISPSQSLALWGL